MTRQALVAFLGIFVLFACVATPVTAAGWSDAAYYDQARYGQNNGNSGGLFKFGPTTSKIAKIGLTATGSVLAGMFGSQFGVVGTVVGGAAGFFVSKWIGDKLFGENCYPAEYNHNNGGGIFQRIKDTIFGRKNNGPYPPVYGGNPGGGVRWSDVRTPNTGSLNDSRQAFYNAMQDYTKALQTGTQAQKEAAKAAYDSARNAYFSAKSN